ncbi:EAL domain-containing protein [Paenibacillus sp. CF384]|uniref:EAL domain-containing protein n=1 Tax=Paenibacillus sp. CF384 TaxID=1884382 RepID=UPI000895E92C|nr:EAL domain-containing protein [Paenibacillus sp. CF384]SDW54829.1 diguanylate cyclase (GGDEF) domain-containing protein [Paenibacillus sp. CF384]
MRRFLGLMERPEKYGVLVVDDSAVMRRMITMLIEKDPKLWVMATAANGQEALDQLVELQPDLVTMDIEMPVLDGLTTLSHLMIHYPIPVIMLSSYTDEGSSPALAALSKGAADFFHKDALFQFPHNEQVEEEFLLRCHAAIEAKPFWKKLEQDELTNREFKLLLEFMTGCLVGENTIHEELNRTMRLMNGIYASVIKVNGQFMFMDFKGELFYRFGKSSQSFVGQPIDRVFQPENALKLNEQFQRAWDGEQCISFEMEWKKACFLLVLRPLRVNGVVKELIGVCFEVTDQKRMEEKVHFLLNHDQLTGLPNRNQLYDEMDRVNTLYDRFAVMYFNFDHFKLINDSIGHQKSNSLLQLFSRRLKRITDENTMIIRAGTDEFICIIGDASAEITYQKAQNLLDTIHAPVMLDGQEIHMTASIGISQYPGDHRDKEMLIRYAHMAMNIAKGDGGNRLQFYEPRFHEQIHRKLEIESRLRKAIERKEFLLHYQPILNGRDRVISGLECLIRWQSPELGRVSPAEFIPIAEETGLIHSIGEWVLLEACRQNKRWQDDGFPKIPIAVNLSTRQFNDGKIIERIENILNETGLEAEYLVIEITESMTMNKHHALALLRNLKKLGVSIAIDDFGTGYSSLSYLSELPIDKLKIDQSFVKGMNLHNVNASIVNTIITMAENLNLQVIAEGVEEEEECRLLLQYGCMTMQGYLFGHPMESVAVSELLAAERFV